MIPKIIYTTWISDKEYPSKYKPFLEGWQKIMPDYQIIVITKENVVKSPFVQKALEIGNYTLAGHYGRCERLYETGGIYFDIDIEAVKSFDPLLNNIMFLGREAPEIVNNAVIGCEPKQPFIKDCLSYMDNIDFNTPSIELATGPRMFSNIYKNYKDKIKIYPEEYFYPYHHTKEFDPKCITPNTFAIHHWGYTWNNLVSVVIPCYKQAHYLAGAIESCLNQTVKPFEIIVVNDGSPDNTSEIAKKYPVKLIEQENKGLSAARNAGIYKSKGKYVVCLDSDDKLEPHYIEKLKGLDDIACPSLKTFGDINGFWSPPKEHPTYQDFLERNHLFCASLFKRDVWEKIGGFDEQMKDGYEDWDFWIRAAKAGFTFTAIKDVLYQYRRTGKTLVDHAKTKHNDILNYMYKKYLMDIEDRNDLGKLYQEHYKTGLGVEVGVEMGCFALEILKHWKGDYRGVDIWQNETHYGMAKARIEDKLGEGKLLKMPSLEAAKLFEDESLDWVYIDANHKYENVKADYNTWYPKVRKGGIISGHDYGDNDCIGIKQFIDEIGKDQFKFTKNTFNNRDYFSWYKIKYDKL